MKGDKNYNGGQRPTLCWSCRRACGGCSWTARDPKTHEVRFEPVEGWEAEKTLVRGTSSRRHGHKIESYSTYYYATESYRVLRCPLYEKDKRQKARSAVPDWAVRAGNKKGG